MPVVVEITFSKKATRSEPRLAIMDDMVELIDAVIGLRTPLAFPPKEFSYTRLTSEQMEIVHQRKVSIMQEAVRLAEGREDARDALYALYVLGTFRLGLTVKHLTWLTSKLNKSSGHLRSLCELARRDEDPRYQGAS